MRKPAFCICENKDADQLRSNPEDRFSQNEAQINEQLTVVREQEPLVADSSAVKFDVFTSGLGEDVDVFIIDFEFPIRKRFECLIQICL